MKHYMEMLQTIDNDSCSGKKTAKKRKKKIKKRAGAAAAFCALHL